MNRLPTNSPQSCESGICGFRQYVLNEPRHLSFASVGLCSLLGVGTRALVSQKEDLYEGFVHPKDRQRYRAFLCIAKDGQRSLSYRLQRKNGEILTVTDTLTVSHLPDGTAVGEAVLTQASSEETSAQEPCGFLRFTCEKQPKITQINRKMMEILHLPETQEGEQDYLELYRDNVFLMLPMEERRRFARYLELMQNDAAPMTGEMTLLRCDGTKAHVFGWVTRTENQLGEEEFETVCMDVTQRYQERKDRQTRRYLKALTDVYDKIFEYDRSSATVKCIHDAGSSRFSWIRDIPMQMEEATEKWIADTVVPEEQEKVKAFFRAFCENRLSQSDAKPPRISYRVCSSSGEIRNYEGIILNMDEQVSLYCCRCVPNVREAEQLRTENDSLKENMQEIMLRFTDGIAAFEVTDSTVTPLYVSDNLCMFFGRTREEWLPLMKKATPIREFVSQSTVDYEKFAQLLRDGEAEFSYLDLETGRLQRMKAICSHKSPRAGAVRYVMLYNVEPECRKTDQTVSVRTFGYFDVFVGDSPIAFRNKKSKELFALLVDRRGGFITSEEAISYLWEDEPVNSVTLARYRKVALRLKNILAEYGISDVMESVDGKRRIVPQKLRCDLYDYLSGKEEYAQLFKGSYLSNYSWGETTLAELTGNVLGE